MPLSIVRNDITRMSVDAIVNAANPSLLGGGGVDGAIHRCAGPELLEECKTLGGCKTGQAKITKGYHLMCKYVIHTVGPVWMGGDCDEHSLLASCYRNSLNLAKAHNCHSIAFPIISSGAYGFPREQALQIAIAEIQAYLDENDMLVSLVVYDKSTFAISKKLIADITEYIDDNYTEDHFYNTSSVAEAYHLDSISENVNTQKLASAKETPAINPYNLDDMLTYLDESFSEMLLRKIDQKGMTDAQCYKKANIDRKLFSKIRSDKNYRPRKTTVLAFAVALELTLPETKELLMRAGYALTRFNKFDIIVEYFISKGNYNLYEINEVLFAFDQVLLGE